MGEATGAIGMPLPATDVADLTPINMSGSAGKVALVTGTVSLGCNGGSAPCDSTQLARIVDLVGYGGANFYEGSGRAPALTNATAAFRAGGGCTDTDDNASDFGAAAPLPRNTASTFNACSIVAPTDPSGTGSANPASVAIGGSSLLTVAVVSGTNPASAGLAATVDLSSIGGAASQLLYDDGTHGDESAGDLIFSVLATVQAGTSAGPKSLTATIRDAQNRSATAPIALMVDPAVVPIHEIQGSSATSPYMLELVGTTGVVTGVKSNGFFIQVPDADVDSDPNSSEGLFVFTSGAPSAVVTIGSFVKVVGTVQEYVPLADPFSPPMTELGGHPVVTLLSSGGPLPEPITLTAADASPAGALDQLERFEGMRVRVASLTVVGPTGGNVSEVTASAESNGVFYGVITGVDRPFREPGVQVPDLLPTGAPSQVPRFDGNPERLRVDSDGQPGAAPLDVAAGAVVTGLVGPLDYAYRTYTILPDVTPPPTATGGLSAASVPAPSTDQFTVASFNMEGFYDAVNDPDTSDTVLTPFAFAARLDKASLIIRTILLSPDIIGVQEVENLTTLQAVADKVNADAAANGQPDPGYQAYLVEGLDVGGIDVGFLVKSVRVQVLDVTQYGKDALYVNPNTRLPELLNDRPPLVLRARVSDPRGGAPFAITVIVNHLRSLLGVDDAVDGNRVRAKRRAGAEFLAALIQQRQAADPAERIVSLGDYNAYQFSDGYVDVVGTVVGAPAPFEEVVLASADLVEPNLTDLATLLPADQRYTYLQDGSAQVLDHILVSSNMLARLGEVTVARVNADFPEVFRSDWTRPERLSDHDIPVAYFTFPTADLAVAKSGAPDPVLSGSTITYTIAVTNTAADDATDLVVVDTLPEGVTVRGVSAPNGWSCSATSEAEVRCSASTLGAGATATLGISADVRCDLLNDGRLTNEATVSAASFDQNPSNNTARFVSTVLNSPPVITEGTATPSVLWPVNHRFVPVIVGYAVCDNCDPAPVCSLSVASNEPEDGRGDGHSSADWLVVDAHRLLLRAERSGIGSGRVYAVTISCADASGNVGRQTVVVTVPKSRK